MFRLANSAAVIGAVGYCGSGLGRWVVNGRVFFETQEQSLGVWNG